MIFLAEPGTLFHVNRNFLKLKCLQSRCRYSLNSSKEGSPPGKITACELMCHSGRPLLLSLEENNGVSLTLAWFCSGNIVKCKSLTVTVCYASLSKFYSTNLLPSKIYSTNWKVQFCCKCTYRMSRLCASLVKRTIEPPHGQRFFLLVLQFLAVSPVCCDLINCHAAWGSRKVLYSMTFDLSIQRDIWTITPRN